MTTTPPEGTPDPQPTPDPEPEAKPDAELFDAPKDADDSVAKGYAVYDRVLGRYVSPVSPDKPSAKDAKAAAGDHSYRTVRV